MYSYTNDISRSLSRAIVSTHDANMDHQHRNIIQVILKSGVASSLIQLDIRGGRLRLSQSSPLSSRARRRNAKQKTASTYQAVAAG